MKKEQVRTQVIEEILLEVTEPQERYQLIIELGKSLPAMPQKFFTDDNRVKGCQSTLYLHTFLENDRLKFFAHCDALISKGLAAILIRFYENQTLEHMLHTPPTFIQELDLLTSLSFNRSNGFAHIYQKMKQDALKLLIEKHKN